MTRPKEVHVVNPEEIGQSINLKIDSLTVEVDDLEAYVGPTTDATVAAGAEGSLNAKARRLTADIGTLKEDSAKEVANTTKVTRILTSAGTEGSHVLDARCIAVEVSIPSKSEAVVDQLTPGLGLRIAFTAGQTADGQSYMRVPAGGARSVPENEKGTLYYLRDQATDVEFEVVEFLR